MKRDASTEKPNFGKREKAEIEISEFKVNSRAFTSDRKLKKKKDSFKELDYNFGGDKEDYEDFLKRIETGIREALNRHKEYADDGYQ